MKKVRNKVKKEKDKGKQDERRMGDFRKKVKGFKGELTVRGGIDKRN